MEVIEIVNANLKHGSGYGGAISGLVNELSKQGVNFHIVSSDVINEKYRTIWRASAAQKVKNILSNKKIDLIHGNSPDSVGYTLIREKGNDRIPYVITFHNSPNPYVRRAMNRDSVLWQNFVQALKKPLNKKSIDSIRHDLDLFLGSDSLVELLETHLADHITLHSKSVAELFINQYRITPNKVNVLSNGIHVFDTAQKVEALRKRSHNDKHGTIILAPIANVRKGLSTFLKATPLIIKQNKSVSIVLLGNHWSCNSILNYYTKMYAPNLIWYPWVKDIFEIYARADICVLPSFSEGLPLSMLEAMASKVSFITTNAPGILDHVTNRQNAMVTKCNDYKGIAENVNELISNEELRYKISENAYRQVQRYDWSIVGKEWLAYYERIAN